MLTLTGGVLTSPSQFAPANENWTVSNILIDLANYLADNSSGNAAIGSAAPVASNPTLVLTRPGGFGGGSVTFSFNNGLTTLDGHAPEGGDVHTEMTLTSNTTAIAFQPGPWRFDLAIDVAVFTTGNPGGWSVANGQTPAAAWSASAIPEPSSLLLLAASAAGAGSSWWLKRKARKARRK